MREITEKARVRYEKAKSEVEALFGSGLVENDGKPVQIRRWRFVPNCIPGPRKAVIEVVPDLPAKVQAYTEEVPF